MNEVRSVISLWPDRETLAADCDVTEYALEQWEKRGYFPPLQWPKIVTSAKKHCINKINLDFLAEMKPKKIPRANLQGGNA